MGIYDSGLLPISPSGTQIAKRTHLIRRSKSIVYQMQVESKWSIFRAALNAKPGTSKRVVGSLAGTANYYWNIECCWPGNSGAHARTWKNIPATSLLSCLSPNLQHTIRERGTAFTKAQTGPEFTCRLLPSNLKSQVSSLLSLQDGIVQALRCQFFLPSLHLQFAS